MQETKITEIIYILDRSGSMSSMREAAITAFNNFVNEQIQIPGVAKLTLVQFNKEVTTPILAQLVEAVPFLNRRTYRPNGSTALLDAIGSTITATEHRIQRLPEDQRPSKVIVAIFTDGHENASQEFTQPMISKLIGKKREQDHWDFLFLAANQDAIKSARKLNIPQKDAANVTFHEKGVKAVGSSLIRKVKAMRQYHMGFTNSSILEELEKPMNLIQKEEEKPK